MPKVMYRCREQINHKEFHSVCLIKSKFNSAEEMTKKNFNLALRKTLMSNTHEIPIKQVFTFNTVSVGSLRLFLQARFRCNMTSIQLNDFNTLLPFLLALFHSFYCSQNNLFWIYPRAELQLGRISLRQWHKLNHLICQFHNPWKANTESRNLFSASIWHIANERSHTASKPCTSAAALNTPSSPHYSTGLSSTQW